MKIHLVNPSDHSFGTAVITPRWLFVLAAATPQSAGDPILTDESLEPIDPEGIHAGDIVGISVHTGNALRGYQVGRMARARGAWVVYGGIHATLFPQEALEVGEGHAVVKGDGDVIWARVVADCIAGHPEPVYDGGRIAGTDFLPARWDLMQPEKYMWASVQTIRGCPKHCSFCSVWRTDGQQPRQRKYQNVIDEIITLRRIGFRFIALADDNFYPVTLTDLRLAREQNNLAKVEELTAIRADRFHLMEELAKLPKDMVFFTQITMEAGEDGEYLDAMRRANIKGALVGVEAVTPEGLKAVFKDWNYSGDALARQLQTFREHGVHVLGSFIFGLPTDRPATFDATVEMALKAGVTFAQFVMMTPFPGTVDFGRWEKTQAEHPTTVNGIPITRYWLIPSAVRPKMFTPHPTMSADEIRRRTQRVWDRFYTWSAIWQRSACTPTLWSRVAFIFLSKLYRQMYAGTGISTDSARRKKSQRWARWTARQCKRLFHARPMPELPQPQWHLPHPAASTASPFAVLPDR
ncbi:MAG TPA: radical SAM protein [Terracidiphilus sp.]|nr:radical SAM protein [Terracidiphilus sp.]